MVRYRWRLTLIALALIASARPLALPQEAPPTRDASVERTLRLIIVESADQAQQIVERLTHGESFAALARTLSIDPSAADGGSIGRLAPSALRPELRQALDGVRAGQIGPIVRVPTGFAILKVEPDEPSATQRAPGSASPAAGAAPAGAAAAGAVSPGAASPGAASPGAVSPGAVSPGAAAAGAAAGPSAAVSAVGGVKYAFTVAGLGEVQASLNAYPKAANWNQDPRTICALRTQSTAMTLESLEAFLSSPTRRAQATPVNLMQAYFGLAQIHAYQGQMEASIAAFQAAHRITVDAAAAEGAADVRLQLEEALGVAYLHKAELENGVYHEPGHRCLLSPEGVQAFTKTGDVEKAIEHFSNYLAGRPDELEVKWLLNLSYMALGGYPAKVPPAHLIPPAALASAEDVGRFADVAALAGLTSFSAAGAAVVDDLDNDGRLDIVTSSFDSCAPMRLFRGNGDGTFTERGAAAGLGDQVGGLNAVQTDYDNDGCLDLLLMRGAWDVAQRKSLLRNQCDGTFKDVTIPSGLALPATSTQAAVWTDVNNDGFLDLFIGNEDRAAQLFMNKGDGTFHDVAERAGVARTAFSKGVAAGDYDNDGWPDLYVSNLSGPNFLYRNNHDGTFAERGQAAGAPGNGKGFATWFFDYDNDGWQDLFVTSYFTSVDETVRTYLKLPNNATTLKLYRNQGDGTFRDVTRQAALDKVFMPMGANYGDIDNDGFLDLYLGTGNPSYASLVPSVLLRNKGGASFVDVTASSGTGELHKGHGVAFADLDNDGDEEIVFEVGGATPGDAHALRLFENPGHGHDWITLRLIGVKTNRAAIGARIAVTVEQAGGGTRVIHRTVGSGGSFGASPLQQHVGLGKAARIVDVAIWWPTSNTRQRFTSIEKNQTIQITEQADRVVALERPRVRLGGAKRDASSAQSAPPAAPASSASAPPARSTPSTHTVRGMVVSVDAAGASFVVSHEAVPGVMAAMTMPFEVRDAADLKGLVPGTTVEFTLVLDADSAIAERIRVRPYESADQDPFTAQRLTLLNRLIGAAAPASEVVVGQAVPDFTLTNQIRQPVSLSQFRGRVVALNFIYTSCALPQFCFRITNHFGVLQQRFKERLGRDVVLLTVTFDPLRDTPDTLAEYARRWRPSPETWHFLTGAVPDVQRVCGLFGTDVFQDEGLMNHSLHTAIIDRQGTLAANIEGNKFSATQLGDLLQSVLDR